MINQPIKIINLESLQREKECLKMFCSFQEDLLKHQKGMSGAEILSVVSTLAMLKKFKSIMPGIFGEDKFDKNGKKIEPPPGGGGEDGFDSRISEPKQSRIQHIVINIIKPFENQKVSMGGGDLNIKELAPKFTEYLLSLVEDASILVSE